MVWPQMRTMRLNSRMMMVENPTHSARARDTAATLGACDGSAGADVDQSNEELLEPVHLVPHAVDFDALRRKPREYGVQTLPLRHLDLEAVIVAERCTKPRKLRRTGQRLVQIEDENLGLQFSQHIDHGIALDDAAAFDDGDIAAQILGFLQIVGGQNDGRPALVQIPQ